jgi:hypothetical protein
VLILSFSYFSELFLAISCHFAWLCCFSCPLLAFEIVSCHFAWLCRFFCLLLAFAVVLLLDDLLELFLAFWVF